MKKFHSVLAIGYLSLRSGNYFFSTKCLSPRLQVDISSSLPKMRASNIMDYKDKVFVNGKLQQIDDFEKISTYHWQWVVINPNLVKLDSKTPITTNNLFKEISKL